MALQPWEEKDQVVAPSEAAFTPPDKPIPAAYGGKGASIGPDRDTGGDLWAQTARAVRGALGGDAMFGDPERASLKDTGIGLQPTPAEMIESLGTAASAFSGAGAVAEGAALPGQVAGAMRGSPGVVGALSKALPAAIRNSPNAASAVGAMGGGYVGGKVGGVVGKRAEGAAVGTALGLLAARRLGRPSIMAEVVGEPTPATPPIMDAEYVTNPVGKVAGELSTADSAARALPAAMSPKMLPPARSIQLGPASTPKPVLKAVEKAVDAAPAKVGPKSVITPITDAETLQTRIKELREVQKLSGAQIAAALKQWHGIPMKEATQAVKMVLGAQ